MRGQSVGREKVGDRERERGWGGGTERERETPGGRLQNVPPAIDRERNTQTDRELRETFIEGHTHTHTHTITQSHTHARARAYTVIL